MHEAILGSFSLQPDFSCIVALAQHPLELAALEHHNSADVIRPHYLERIQDSVVRTNADNANPI